jgi:hypothetical protein
MISIKERCETIKNYAEVIAVAQVDYESFEIYFE